MKTYKYKDYEITVQDITDDYNDNGSRENYEKQIVIVDSDFCKYIEISVADSNETKKLLLSVSYYTPVDSCVAYHADGLVLMLDDMICLLKPESLELTEMIELDVIGTMFEIYPYNDDYILYGELYILRMNKKFQIVWDFTGMDIFVKIDGDGPAFEMLDDKICLYDFLGNYYEIGYDGKLQYEKRI